MSKGISETAFASQVEDLLSRFQWHWMHQRPARVIKKGKETYRTAVSGHGKGFLDYIALRPPRILVIELKSEKGKMTPEQQEWFDLWEECQKTIIVRPLEIKGNKVDMKFSRKVKTLVLPEVYLWKPSDFDKVVECLR